MSKKAKTLKIKANIDNIHVGPFKPVKYYEADIEAPEKWLEYFRQIGRQVITEDQYLNIGFNHVVTNAVNNKFKLESLKKYKKKK